MERYAELYKDNKLNVGFTQANREQGIRRLMAINLMKRMESSVYSLNLTLIRIKDLFNNTLDRFYKQTGKALIWLIYQISMNLMQKTKIQMNYFLLEKR